MKDAEIKPMINQVEYHPRLTQKELQAFCKEQGIQWKHGHHLCKVNY